MSKYTRPYDTGSRSYDTSTRPYDSTSRLQERGSRLSSSGSDGGTELAGRRYGLHTSRNRDTDLRNYDVSTRKYDLAGSGSDITTRSPARPSSYGSSDRDGITDYHHESSHLDPTSRQSHRRQRNGSGDSTGSQSSERSDARSTDSTLFNVYKSRYRDRLGQESSSSTAFKEPSVSYVPKRQTNLDIDPIPELENVEKTQNGERIRDKERSDTFRSRDIKSRSSSREVSEDPISPRLSKKTKEDEKERSDSFKKRDWKSRYSSNKEIGDDSTTKLSERSGDREKERLDINRHRDWKSQSTSRETSELPVEPQGHQKSQEKSGDELLSNFRKAIRKHASADEKRKSESESTRPGSGASKLRADRSVLSGDSKLEDKVQSDVPLHRTKHEKTEAGGDRGKRTLRIYQHLEHTDLAEAQKKKLDESVERDKSREKTAVEGPVRDGRKSPRKMKSYAKAKTADLGQLSHEVKEVEMETEAAPPVSSQDDASLYPSSITMDELSQMTRQERIARYKEERKKQLATIAARIGSGHMEAGAMPSLFLSQSDEASPLSRSRSLKVETDYRPSVSVSRSKSLKEETDKLKINEEDSTSPSFKPLGISGLSLAERGSKILEDDTAPRKAPLDSRLFDHMQNFKKLHQKHQEKEKISIEELQAKRSSRGIEDLEAVEVPTSPQSVKILTSHEAKEGREKDREKLSQRVGEKRQRDEKLEVHSSLISADSDSDKHRSRLRRKLPSIEDILGTSTETSPPNVTNLYSPEQIGSISSQSSLSTQSTSSQKLSSRTSSSGSEVSRTSTSLSDASRSSRVPSVSVISEDVFHDTKISKKDEPKTDQLKVYSARSRTPSGSQKVSDFTKKSSDEVSSPTETEVQSARIQGSKVSEMRAKKFSDDSSAPTAFGKVYYKPRQKEPEEEKTDQNEQKHPKNKPVTKISYRDLEKKERDTKSPQKERETKSSHRTEREVKSPYRFERDSKSPAAAVSNYKPSSTFVQTEKIQQLVWSSKDQEKKTSHDKHKKDTVSVEEDVHITARGARELTRPGKERYLETISKDGDEVKQPPKKDFGVSYISSSSQESSAKINTKRRAQQIDPSSLLGEETDISEAKEIEARKMENKVQGKQVEPKSLLVDSSKSDVTETKERSVPSSSQKPHQKDAGTSEDLRGSYKTQAQRETNLSQSSLEPKRKESRKEKEQVSTMDINKTSNLVSSSSVSLQTSSKEQQSEPKSTIRQISLEKVSSEEKDSQNVSVPSEIHQQSFPKRGVEHSESKQQLQKGRKEETKLFGKSTEIKTPMGVAYVSKPIPQSPKADRAEVDTFSETQKTSSERTSEFSDAKIETKPVKDISNFVHDKEIDLMESRTVRLSRKPRIGEDTKISNRYLADRESHTVHLPKEEKSERLSRKDNQSSTPTKTVEVDKSETVVQEEKVKLVSSVPHKFLEDRETKSEILPVKQTGSLVKDKILENKPDVFQVLSKPLSDVTDKSLQSLKTETDIQPKKPEVLMIANESCDTLKFETVTLSDRKKLQTETAMKSEYSSGIVDSRRLSEDLTKSLEAAERLDDETVKMDSSTSATVSMTTKPLDSEKQKKESPPRDIKTNTPSVSVALSSSSLKKVEDVLASPVTPTSVSSTTTDPSKSKPSAKVERKPSKDKKSKLKLFHGKKKKLPEKRDGSSPLTLLDSTLDDLLGKNIAYLSDLEAPDFSKSKSESEAKSRPKSVIADSSKQSLRKAALKNTQSMPECKDVPKTDGIKVKSMDTKVVQEKAVEVKGLETKITDVKVTKAVPITRETKTVEDEPEKEKSIDEQREVTSKVSTSSLQITSSSDKTSELKPEIQSISAEPKDDYSSDGLVPLEPVHSQRYMGDLSEKSQQFSCGSVDMVTMLYVDDTKPDEKVTGFSSMSLPGVQSANGENISTTTTEVFSLNSDNQVSDASDVSERRRVRARDLDYIKDEVSKMVQTDSDSLSQASDASRRRRKDKAALRKSKLNEPNEIGDERRGRPGQRPASPRTNKISVRKTSSGTSSKLISEKTSNSSVKEEVSSAITKLSEAKDLSHSTRKKEEDISKSPKRIARGNNFNKLLEKFSSSDASGSERSDQDSSPRRKFLLKRQEACAVSSGSSDETRRTPERTQSLKLQRKRSPSPEKEKDKDGTVQRSNSFKSDFMKRRFSPEPTARVKLPEPAKPSDKPTEELAKVLDKRSHIVSEQQKKGEVLEREKIHNKKVEKADQHSEAGVEEVIADSEVASVLRSRRKETDSSVKNDQDLEVNQAVVKSDRFSAAGVEHVIADSEVLSALRSRRKETDSNLQELEKENVDKSDRSRLVDDLSSKPDVHETSSPPPPHVATSSHASSLSFKFHHSSSQSSQSIEKENDNDVLPVSDHHISKSTSITQTVKETGDHPVSDPKISQSVPIVPKLDLSAIDTSLEVLSQVTHEISKKSNQDDSLHSTGNQLCEALSKVKVNSPREVVQFIKSVQNEQKSDSVSSVKIELVKDIPATVKSDSDIKDTKKYDGDFKRESSPRIENAAKKDIIRMFSREGTPDRSSPSRNVPVKVTSSFKGSSLSSGLRRSESAGRADSMDRPKGILKRTPSLKQSGVNVDPELADVLKSRRARHGDVEEEDDKKRLTALEEIRQAREQQQQEGDADKDNEEEKVIPISERIFHMENKIEEAKSCPITPRPRSGFATPKSVKEKSGNITPKSQFSFDDGQLPAPAMVSGDQLMQRLTSLEEKGATVSKRRAAFQKTRKQDDWRTRTQPVTQEEVVTADSLESVRKFRLDILRKASSSIFDSIQQQERPELQGIKTEFPQHYKKDDAKSHRTRSQRHKTLPVTAAELGAIPEDKSLSVISLQKKTEAFSTQDSKGDSGILSGSEADCSIEKESLGSDSSRSLDTDLPEDDPSKLSVMAKATMFQRIEKAKISASGAKRYIDRKKRERSRTQPVTEDEVKTAAEIADSEIEEEEKKKREAEESIKLAEKGDDQEEEVMPEKEESEEPHDELSRRSLAEKVKLFSSLKELDQKPTQKKDGPVTRRRNRRQQPSRFATQPVTIEEVEKAAKISPLAMSMVKPPDPELLRGLSFQAQRDLMAQHAEACLSRSTSQQSLRGASSTDLTDETKSEQKGILKSGESGDNTGEVKSILKDSPRSPEKEVKGILKSDLEKLESPEPKSILKHLEHVEESDLDKKSILRSTEKSVIGRVKDVETTDVKRTVEDSSSQGILKSELVESVTVTSSISETKSVLKTESVFETSSEPRGILKKDSSFETKKLEPDKPILKSSEVAESRDSRRKGILKNNEEEKNDDSSEEFYHAQEELSSSPSPERELEGGEITQDTKKKRDSNNSSRRRFRDRKEKSERYKTQPAELTQDGTPEASASRKKMKYTGRHLTQPVTPEEKKEAEIATDMVEVKSSGSIAERLNALKKSGEEDWRKRVSHDLDIDNMTPAASPAIVRLREKKDISSPRPSSIADRLHLLKSSGEEWRGRVEESDAQKFTVAHKITSSGQGVNESPLVARLKKTPRREIILKDFDSGESSDLPSPSTPTKESSKIPLPKEVICTTEIEVEGTPALNAVKEEYKEAVNVEVPKMDDELESFFSTSMAEITETTTECTVDDFDELFIVANDMLSTTKKIKPKRKHTAKSKNPLKAMSENLEVRSEYTEVIKGVADKEMKRVKTSQIAQHAGFAVEALAGLASKENFSKVELRKTEGGATPGNVRNEPYQDLMLLHVKGRRRVQTRLVEPCAASLNSGDCFVLVTNDKIIQWIGEYANVIEKAKAADVSDFIKQKKDMGCKNAQSVTIVEERKSYHGGGSQFWRALGGRGDYMACGPLEEDELYENHLVETNMVYCLDNNSLVPVEEYWGNVPRIEMLKSDEVFVFDYGSELYVWQGKTVKPGQRKIGLRLARQLWDKGYDYSACDINPVSPLRSEESGGLPSTSPSRPSWAIFGKVNQNMETILFREKFLDWPDTSRLIKVKSQEEISENKDLVELTAYDAKLMLPLNKSPATLVLEGSHVGRGTNWSEDMEGFVRKLDIVTLDVIVWHVLEYEHYKLPDQSYGQFHEGDTYVVRWQYMITTAGARDLKGQQSKISTAGRERCAYFFWQGKSSTINEKGASALMTVELDEERGPQVRVGEGKEPPCFLNLFKGNMIIHIGKREEEATNTQGTWRFYCVRNELENEMCLLEVPAGIDSLRSRSSFLILNVNTGLLYIWHGCKSPQSVHDLAVAAGNRLKEKCPLEVGLHQKAAIVITEMEEGEEKLDFWRLMDVRRNNRSDYFSLLNDSRSFTHTLRLFHMNSVSGVFEVHEILNPSRTPDHFSPFPVIQADLYKASQPGLFMVDSGYEVYLWQGWWPEGDEEQENVHTGSAVARLNIDRKCAMETTLEYCKEKDPDSPCKAYVVYGGLEPLQFTSLFPFWTLEEEARDSNRKDGKKEDEVVLVEDLLHRVSRTRYTFDELQESPLPEGVDPLKLEWYLSDEEFMDVVEMDKEEFYSLPSWKQTKIKQQVGLF